MADREQLYTALRNADAAGDTEAATKLANYIQTIGPETAADPAAPVPEKRGFMDELGHQAGLTLRAGVNGVMALPNMASDAVTGPINAGLDAVAGQGNGFRFKRAGDVVNSLMDSAGVAKPGNATERVVQDATSAMAGAGGMVKAGQLLAKGGGALAQGVGEALSAGPGLQVASAATGAGASGITREKGGGGVAQALAGLAGSMAPVGVAKILASGSGGTRQLADAAKKANDAGYVIPPKDLNPSAVEQVLDGVGGKIKTSQVASQRNQGVTNQLVKKALGLEEGQDLNLTTLADIRKDAAQAYQTVAATGEITPTKTYADALDSAVQPYLNQAKSFPNRKMPALVDDIQALKTDKFDAKDAIDTIRVIRNDADAAYRAGDKMAGSAYKSASNALEQAIDDHLVAINAPSDLLQNYRDARRTIAQTYEIEKALNPQTGNIDAQKLARSLSKGKPLSEELKTVAEVAQAFPKATQALKEAPGSISALDVAATGIKAALQNKWVEPIVTLGARPAARSISLSSPLQSWAVGKAGPNVSNAMDGATASIAESAVRAKDDYQNGRPVDPRLIPLSKRQPVAPQSSGIDAISKATNVDEAIQAAHASLDPNIHEAPQQSQASNEEFTYDVQPNGTLTMKGDPQQLAKAMAALGVTNYVPMRGGILIARSQAAKVQELIQRAANQH